MSKVELSLPALQSKAKQDPDGYRVEFERQYNHFIATVETLKDDLHKPAPEFSQLVMFISAMSGSYKGYPAMFSNVLISLLEYKYETLHPSITSTFVSALIVMRNAGKIDLMTVGSHTEAGGQNYEGLLPVWFHLFKVSEDRSLKKMIFTNIVKDISKHKTLASNSDLQTFFFNKVNSSNAEEALKAISIVVELYRRNVWVNARTVNVVASGGFSKVKKIALLAAYFMMGNQTSAQSIIDSSDEEEVSQNDLRMKSVSRKTKGRERRLKRAKEAAEKMLEEKRKKKTALEGSFSFAAIDLLYDPQTFTEKLLRRMTSEHQVFTFRVPMLTLISRIIARHKLLILNFFPYLQRYLFPKQAKVTVILASLAQACHDLVPPQELHGVIKTLFSNFIAEHQSAEVIIVGMNALREICSRVPLGLTREMLEYAASFRSYRNRDVSNTARSIINLYRDLYPSLLHRRIRGKKGNVQCIAETDAQPQYGAAKIETSVKGAEVLFEMKKRVAALDVIRKKRSREILENGNATSKDDDNKSCEESDGVSEDESTTEEFEDDIDTATSDDEISTSVDAGERSHESANDDDQLNDGQNDVSSDDEFDDSSCPDLVANEDTDVKRFSTLTLDTHILSPKDFAQMKVIQNHIATSGDGGSAKRSLNTFLDEGVVRMLKDKIHSTGNGETSDEESDEESSEEEDEVVMPKDLMSKAEKKRRLTADTQQEKEMSKADRKQQIRGANRKHKSIPNTAKSRNKSHVMVKQSRRIKEKRYVDCQTRAASLRKHIKTLKKKDGTKRRFRRL